MIIDYETLKLVWWLLVGILLIGFAITDGFDMGAGALLPFLGKNDEERRVIINTVGPHWDGNQVWFITAGGAIFAAWPAVYAAAFSGFYIAMLLVQVVVIKGLEAGPLVSWWVFVLTLIWLALTYLGRVLRGRWRQPERLARVMAE